jgi:hypothetical protein
VRALTCFLVLAALGSATARADDDDDDDDDGDYEPFPTRSIGIGGYGHATHVANHAEGGFGPTLELAYGRGRWQYLVEGSYASSDRDPTTMMLSPGEERVSGHQWRGVLGARWLARQFMPDSSGGVELFLMSLAGIQHYHYAGGSKLTRPEVGLGVGIQGRVYKKPKLAFRLDMRLLFTPDEEDSAFVRCRELCTTQQRSTTGFMTGMAFAW